MATFLTTTLKARVFCCLILMGILSRLPAQYVHQYGTAGVNDVGKTMLPERDASNALTGNLFIGGNSGGNTLIMRLDGQGNILGQWSFKVSAAGQVDNLNNLRYDRTLGSLIGSGMIPVGTMYTPYVFRFDLTTNTVTWANRFTSLGAAQNVIDAGETIAGVPVIHFFGMSYEPSNYDANYMMMDLNTGVVIPGTERTHHRTNALGEHYATEYSAVDGHFYSSGRWGYTSAGSRYRPNLTRATSNGNLLYNQTYLADSTSTARLYTHDLVLDGGVPCILASGCFGCNSTTVGTNFAISRHNPSDGALLWGRRFDITAGLAGSEIGTAVIINAAGNYVVSGNSVNTSQRLFITEITPTGTVLWGNSFASTVPNYIPVRTTNELVELNGGYYMLATLTNGGDDNILLIKTDNLGQVPGCVTSPLTISVSPLTAQQPISSIPGGSNTDEIIAPVDVTPNVTAIPICTATLAVEDEVFLEVEADGSLARLRWFSAAPHITEFTLAGGIHPYPLIELQTHPAGIFNSTYLPLQPGPYYFQIRATLPDGSILKSNVKRVWIEQAAALAASSTLLHRGDEVVFHLAGEPQQSATLLIYNMAGQLCSQQSSRTDKLGGCEFHIPTSQLSKGVYFAQYGRHTLHFLVY